MNQKRKVKYSEEGGNVTVYGERFDEEVREVRDNEIREEEMVREAPREEDELPF